jgi:sugar lactone lactonase YvrE
MNIFLTGAALLATSAAAFAVETKWWQQSGDDFQKGALTRVSLSSDGRLTLAPVVKELFDASTAFLWAVARDSKGNVYAGGGGLGSSKSKLFVVDPQGRAKPLAELDGIAIQAIAVDASDRVYAATSPDGKVYRVDSSGKAEVFYDPKSKYIWALAFDRAGNLYVGTGDEGEIHRVSPNGAGSVFFRTEEAHARSLAVDSSGNLIAGTDPSGLILRITPAGQGFVLYQAPKREITAVAVAPDGAIYAAGVGNKQAALVGALPAAAPAPAQGAAGPNPAPATITVTAAQRPNAAPGPVAATQTLTGGSEIYRIQSDGYPRKIWSDAQDVVYALAFDRSGKPIAATGNRGILYRLDSDYSFTQLATLPSTQATGLCSAPDGTLFAVTGNIGKLFSVGPGPETSGTFESDVFDAGAFSDWGRAATNPETEGGLTIETRSGNLNRPQQNWSPWQKLTAGRVVSPPARFIQYRLTLTGKAWADEMDIAYQLKNVAPTISEIEITPANYKFPAAAAVSSEPNHPSTMSLPPLGRKPPANNSTAGSSGGATPAMTWAKGYIGVRWLAGDDDGDALQYKIEIRGAKETEWKPLCDKLREHYFSWDSAAFPDGQYVVRITASDAPSNPPDQVLNASRESDPFLIDNSPPEIACCTVSGSEVRFRAKDALSDLARAEYSINGGEWTVVEPTTRLTDSKEEEYRVPLPRLQGETTVAVRVEDEYANPAVAKTVVKP